ncbi:MAG: alcohol dehydrogenase catalytic domain-containing protein [Candidatus Hydrogenedentes bacterium]|nr:alcohol dehydrogenase catalytic domain-containing protein [Candidatus Hydrogenedentota bacterium]
MKAIHINETGDLNRLVYGEVPSPRPAPGEVVINVRAAALNHLDIRVRRGRPGVPIQAPHVLGSDASGTISELGPSVTGLHIGDEVILNPGVSCGHCEFCLRGEQSECPAFGIVGMSRPGTFAEQVSVPAVNVHPKPAHLNFEEAAALPLAYVTAWRLIMTRGGLKAGETALIHGIGGGVAIAALQLAKLAGATAIVTSSSDHKLARARALGADHGVNYRKVGDIATEIKKLTDGRGV